MTPITTLLATENFFEGRQSFARSGTSSAMTKLSRFVPRHRCIAVESAELKSQERRKRVVPPMLQESLKVTSLMLLECKIWSLPISPSPGEYQPTSTKGIFAQHLET